MLTIEVDLEEIKAHLNKLQSATIDSVRVAAQAAAQVAYVELKLNAPISEKAHFFYGSAAKKAPKGKKKQFAYEYQPGNLYRSIYQYYNKRLSTPEKAVYSVSWNHEKAPYGYMVEYGTKSGAPAQSFLRKSYDNVKDDIVRVAKAKLVQNIKDKMK